MDKKIHRIAPYEKEHWDWLLNAAVVWFMCWCFCTNVDLDMPGWGYALIFGLACLGFGLARIRQRGVELYLSEDGIRVRNGTQETVPLTPWSAFDAAYILKLIWYGDRTRHADTYFLLSGKPLDMEMLDRIAFDLLTTKPTGIWKDYIAIQTKKADSNTIRSVIGSWLPLKELRIDTDAFGEDMED